MQSSKTIKIFLTTLLILFTFISCNSSSSSSNTDGKKSNIIFLLDTDILHTMSSSSYKVYDTNSSKDITYESYISIDDVDIAYYKNRRIYAQNSGETTLNIYYKGVKSTFTLKVSDADMLYIQASSDTYSLHENFTSSLTCKAYFSDRTSQDISYDVAWSSSDDSRAKILSQRVQAVSPGNVNITARYRDKSSFFTTKILSGSMDSLILSEDTLSLHEQTYHQFSARAHFSDGSDEDITKDVLWSSTSPQVAQIDTDALLKANQQGLCNIEAKVGNFTQTARVTVLKSSPTNIKIISPQEKLRLFKLKDQNISSYGCFNLLVNFDDGLKQLVNRGVKWKSSDIKILDIDKRGCYKTLSSGNVDIEASFDDMSDTISLKVQNTDIVSLQLHSPVTSIKEGLNALLQSVAIDKEKNRYRVNSESFWHSSNQEIISVANTKESSGQILARKSGISTIKTDFGSLYASMDVTVGTPALKELKIVPDINESVPVGYGKNLKVYAYYIDGTTQEITQSVFFKSSKEHIATVSNDETNRGELKALSKGSTTITASYGAVITTFILNVVEPEVVSLIIDAPQTTINRSDSMKIKAYAIYSNGAKRDFTYAVKWSTYPSYVASVSARGNFYAVNIGRVYVNATYNDITATQSINVIEPKIISVIIQELANRVDVNKSISLRAYIDYKDGRRDEATTKVQWVSFNEAIASVDSNATVTGISVGDTKIKALYEGHTASTTITVFKSQQSLTIQSSTRDINVSEDLQLNAAVRYSDDSIEYVNSSPDCNWSSSDNSVLSVNSHGVIHGVSDGNATVTAKYNKLSDTISISVH